MSEPRLDIAGIGSVAVDRLHRVSRILGAEEKGILQPMGDGGPVEVHVGGVVLNHIGWAAMLGLRAGIFGKQADDAHGNAQELQAGLDALRDSFKASECAEHGG